MRGRSLLGVVVLLACVLALTEALHAEAEFGGKCAKGCSKNGECVAGSCVCFHGFGGVSCELKATTALEESEDATPTIVDDAAADLAEASADVAPMDNAVAEGKAVDASVDAEPVDSQGLPQGYSDLSKQPRAVAAPGDMEFDEETNVAWPGSADMSKLPKMTESPTTAAQNTAQTAEDAPAEPAAQAAAAAQGEAAEAVARTGSSTPVAEVPQATVALRGISNSKAGLSKPCANNCSHNGDCVKGECLCRHGYGGGDCSQGPAGADSDQEKPENVAAAAAEAGAVSQDEVNATSGEHCPKDCNGNGMCTAGRCFCKNGFSGDDCAVGVDCEKDLNNCNGHGNCDGGVCVCEPAFYGADCSQVHPLSGIVETGIATPDGSVQEPSDALPKKLSPQPISETPNLTAPPQGRFPPPVVHLPAPKKDVNGTSTETEETKTAEGDAAIAASDEAQAEAADPARAAEAKLAHEIEAKDAAAAQAVKDDDAAANMEAEKMGIKVDKQQPEPAGPGPVAAAAKAKAAKPAKSEPAELSEATSKTPEDDSTAPVAAAKAPAAAAVVPAAAAAAAAPADDAVDPVSTTATDIGTAVANTPATPTHATATAADPWAVQQKPPAGLVPDQDAAEGVTKEGPASKIHDGSTEHNNPPWPSPSLRREAAAEPQAAPQKPAAADVAAPAEDDAEAAINKAVAATAGAAGAAGAATVNGADPWSVHADSNNAIIDPDALAKVVAANKEEESAHEAAVGKAEASAGADESAPKQDELGLPVRSGADSAQAAVNAVAGASKGAIGGSVAPHATINKRSDVTLESSTVIGDDAAASKAVAPPAAAVALAANANTDHGGRAAVTNNDMSDASAGPYEVTGNWVHRLTAKGADAIISFATEEDKGRDDGKSKFYGFFLFQMCLMGVVILLSIGYMPVALGLPLIPWLKQKGGKLEQNKHVKKVTSKLPKVHRKKHHHEDVIVATTEGDMMDDDGQHDHQYEQ